MIYPINGFRGEQAKKGVLPKDHHRDNLAGIKKLKEEFVKKQEAIKESKKEGTFYSFSADTWKLSKFTKVQSVVTQALKPPSRKGPGVAAEPAPAPASAHAPAPAHAPAVAKSKSKESAKMKAPAPAPAKPHKKETLEVKAVAKVRAEEQKAGDAEGEVDHEDKKEPGKAKGVPRASEQLKLVGSTQTNRLNAKT